MIYIQRNSQRFGPYDDNALTSYITSGHVLLCDTAYDNNTGETLSVRKYLKKKNH